MILILFLFNYVLKVITVQVFLVCLEDLTVCNSLPIVKGFLLFVLLSIDYHFDEDLDGSVLDRAFAALVEFIQLSVKLLDFLLLSFRLFL